MLDIDQLIEQDGIFVTDFGDWIFRWRLLTLKEYRVFRGLRDSGTLLPWTTYIEVFKRCTLGSNWLNDRIPVGMVVSVGQLIMYISGDCELDTAKDDISIAREIYPAQSINEIMKRIIFTAFPNYKIEEVESWTRPTLIRNFVLSEHALIYRGYDYEPLDVNEIKGPGEVADERPEHFVDPRSIDFTKLSEEDAKKIGPWAVEEAKDLQAQRSRQLTTEQARQLDKMTRPRR